MDDFLKVQCPHCQAIYKCSAKQLSTNTRSARCARCQQKFLIKNNLITTQPKVSGTTKSATKSDNKASTRQKNKAENDTGMTNPIIIEDTVDDTTVPSSVSVIAYEEEDDDGDWIELLFDDEHQQYTQQNEHDNKHSTLPFSPPYVSPSVAHAKQQNKADADDIDVNLTGSEIFPSDFIETLYKEVKKNQLILIKKQQQNQNNDVKTSAAAQDDNTATFEATEHQQAEIGASATTQQQLPTADTTVNPADINDENAAMNTGESSTADNDVPAFVHKKSSFEKISDWFSQFSTTAKDWTASTNIQDATKQKSFYVNLFWAFGCVSMLLLLLAQYVIFNLDNLIKNPSSQQKLALFCKVVSCSIPSAELQNIIVANQTVRPSTVSAGSTDILASLVNISDEEQLYPNLHVRIYQDETLLGEFIATPENYLTVPQRILSRKQFKLFLLSVDIPHKQITKVDITPLY